jgi:hypothetical protein
MLEPRGYPSLCTGTRLENGHALEEQECHQWTESTPQIRQAHRPGFGVNDHPEDLRELIAWSAKQQHNTHTRHQAKIIISRRDHVEGTRGRLP